METVECRPSKEPPDARKPEQENRRIGVDESQRVGNGFGEGGVDPFRNEPILDFSLAENREPLEKALAAIVAGVPEERPIVIGGERISTGRWIDSRDPGEPERLLGRAACAGPPEVERAVAAADVAFLTWSRAPPPRRAEVLFRAAALLRKKRFDLNALIMLEAGKVRLEADAELAEAVDFLEFYGREMLRYAEGQPLVRIPHERNSLQYIPLGAGAVVAPWNFPLAILAGMSAAAIVTGNTVVVKPSNETPLIAYRLLEVLEEAGLPPGVFNYLPGKGSEIGDPLVQHPRIRFISFTGSRDVGLRINQLGASASPGQVWIKRVIAEMGGKDAIIIDADCDFDAAVEGVVASAFGYQGQKCSACSRAIGVGPIYDELVRQVARRAGEIRIGPVRDGETQVGPVISETAQQGILKYIETGKREGRLVAGGGRASATRSPSAGASGGFFVEPTVFADVPPSARIAQEEIFGPVLTMIRARDFDEALEIANGTQYGLTGAVYSRRRDHLDRASAEFHVGNLYLNRKCTGALVGVHPFGGFKMSGTDSKAGGRDYLLLFLQAKVVSEKGAAISSTSR